MSVFNSDIKTGLTSKEKFIPSKYFYDAKGSDIFRKIMDITEYYLP